MLSGPQQKFCEGIVAGLNGTEAYLAAYPNARHRSAGRGATRLLAEESVRSEISRLRAEAQKQAGSAVLTLIEKRTFLARVVRARPALLEEDSDLWQSVRHTKHGTELRLPDKLAAIAKDNDLAGDGTESEANDALTELLKSIRMADGGGHWSAS
jgi:hypothetical protein